MSVVPESVRCISIPIPESERNRFRGSTVLRMSEIRYAMLRTLVDHWTKENRPLTVRELGRRHGLSSPSTAYSHAQALRLMGYALTDRGIVPTEQAIELMTGKACCPSCGKPWV